MKLLITLVASDVGVSFGRGVGMWLRATLKPEVVYAYVVAQKADLPVDLDAVEAHYLAGGDPEALVRAMVVLRRAAADVGFVQLAVLDLAKYNVEKLTAAFLTAKRRYPGLGFEELSQRTMEGENVVKAVDEGTFVPLAESDDWRVRVEYGPLSEAELSRRVASGEFPEDALVLRPGGSEWQPLRRQVEQPEKDPTS